MEPKQEFILAIMSIAMGGSIVLTLITSMAKVLTSRRNKGGDDRMLAHVDERLSRMEQAIEAMAVEMERIGEGQRFTTKLLSERPAAIEGAREQAHEAVHERVRA